MCVDVWDADGMLLLGTASIILRPLLRQGAPLAKYSGEFDVVRSEADESYDFWYHKQCWFVRRHKLHDGRAMKILIAKEK